MLHACTCTLMLACTRASSSIRASNMDAFARSYINEEVHACMHSCMQMWTCTSRTPRNRTSKSPLAPSIQAQAYIGTWMQKYLHSSACTYPTCRRTCRDAHMHPYIHACVYVYMQQCMYTYMHAHMQADMNAHIHKHKYTCMHLHTFTYMHASVHVMHGFCMCMHIMQMHTLCTTVQKHNMKTRICLHSCAGFSGSYYSVVLNRVAYFLNLPYLLANDHLNRLLLLLLLLSPCTIRA